MDNLDRHINLDGAYNLRDVGGLKTIDGKTLKQGLIFRSDELSKLSDNDLSKIEQLNIKTILDLRTQNERKTRLDRLPPKCSINLLHIPLSDQNRNVNYFQFFFHLTFKGKEINFEQFIKEHYFNNAFNRTEQINRIFTLLCKRKNLPAIVHCTVGKDRTGLISALIQLLCGVSQKDVLDDYMRTNLYIQERVRKMTSFIRWMSLFQISSDKLKPLLQARHEYLNDILLQILAKYGTIENYLITACRLDMEELTNLKSILLD